MKKPKNKIKSFMKLINILRVFVAFLFLISPTDILCEKVPNYTALNHTQRKLGENDNYIIVKYGRITIYRAKIFTNNIYRMRTSIKHIKYKNEILDLEQQFTIEANTEIEIYFSEPCETFDSFFSNGGDGNIRNIKSIDFSHFDSSSLTSTEEVFRGCSSLEEINFNNFKTSKVNSMLNMFRDCYNLKSLDLSNFDTSQVEYMTSMFYGCSNLKSLNLSNFDTSKVIYMKNMFYECNSLDYLDISNFNTLNVEDSENMFSHSLKYISLYNAQIIDTIKDQIDSTIVCVKDDFNIDKSYIRVCDEFEHIDDIIESIDNYIIVQYNQDTTYANGFQRNGITFIKNEGNTIKPTERLEIKSNSKIEIHLYKSIQSLESFFSYILDTTTKNIISFDFSHLDSSSITNMYRLFTLCCHYLTKVDLSNFILNPETNTNELLSCLANIKYLDLSGTNLNSYPFLDSPTLNQLEFLNLYKAKNYDIKFIKKYSPNLMVCQKEKSADNKCGYYNVNTKKFDSTNLIIIYFNINVEYKNGFACGIESRNNIEFLAINSDKIDPNQSFSINKGKKIEIYLKEETTSLQSFFDSNLDHNMLYIKSIDFTLFDSSKVVNMENLFRIYLKDVRN